MRRDFTYIDDIVEAMLRLLGRAPQASERWDGANPDPSFSNAPYRIYNIGHSNPENLMDFIGLIEKETGREAKKNMLPMQPGDVPATYADVSDLERDIGFAPSTPLARGLHEFVEWYKGYYKI
jgi:UDP-glucuronate 4-epimerase